MIAREMIDIIKESPLWDYLSISEKRDALVYAVGRVETILPNNQEHVDISDIVGEVFRD